MNFAPDGPQGDSRAAHPGKPWLPAAADRFRDLQPIGDEPRAQPEVAHDTDSQDLPATERTPFPTAALPTDCRVMVEETAAAIGVDAAFVGVPMLATLSGAIGATRVVPVKRGWSEPLSLWCVIVGISGSGKTPGERFALGPLAERDGELRARSQAAQTAYRTARQNQKREDVSAEPPPPELVAVVGDITLEGLCARLADNPRGICAAPGELASLFGSFDRYRHGNDAATWLDLHDSRPVRVDRRGGDRPSLCVQRPAVSICGGVQPHVLRGLLTPQHRSSGLAARFAFAAPPCPVTRWTEAEPAEETLRAYRRVVLGLADLSIGADGEPVPLPLDRDARLAYVAMFNEFSTLAESADGDLRSAIVKARSYALRIAADLALADAAGRGQAALLRTVGAEWMHAGAQIARYFIEQAGELYAVIAADDAAAEGRGRRDLKADCYALLLKGDRTRSEIGQHFGWNVPAADIDAALGMLASGGKVTPRTGGSGPRGGRPPIIWSVQREVPS